MNLDRSAYRVLPWAEKGASWTPYHVFHKNEAGEIVLVETLRGAKEAERYVQAQVVTGVLFRALQERHGRAYADELAEAVEAELPEVAALLKELVPWSQADGEFLREIPGTDLMLKVTWYGHRVEVAYAN